MSRRRRRTSNLVLEIAMIAIAIPFLLPVYVLVVSAFKSAPEVAASALAPPQSLYLDNFARAWGEASLGVALLSSSFVAVVSVALLVVIGSSGAYALVRGGRRLDSIVFFLFVAGITIPLQLGMVPLYQLMRDLELLNNPLSLIIYYSGHLLPITVFLYAGFIRVSSRTYEEAAFVDGASAIQTFAQIVFPLLRPVTGTVIILNAIGIWNDFLVPLLYVGTSNFRTVPVAIFAFQGEYATQWGIIFAGLLIAIVPILVVYFVLQKYIIKGFASGLKG